MSPEEKQHIIAQVASMVNKLQAIHENQPGVIGGGISHGPWFSDIGAGPFPSKEIFERWINWKLALSQFIRRENLHVPPIYCPYFVLTHGDLSPRNLILDTDDQVWLVDWGCSGFYPPIFEAASAKSQLHYPEFAKMLLPEIYNDAGELEQLEACAYGIRSVMLSVPPGMARREEEEKEGEDEELGTGTYGGGLYIIHGNIIWAGLTRNHRVACVCSSSQDAIFTTTQKGYSTPHYTTALPLSVATLPIQPSIFLYNPTQYRSTAIFTKLITFVLKTHNEKL